jgi:hypothetical protein
LRVRAGTRKALFAPQTLGALAIDRPAPAAQLVMRAAIPPSRALAGDQAQRRPKRLIISDDGRLAPLGRAVLGDIPTSPALAQRQAVAQHHDRLAPAGRAHQFPGMRMIHRA